MRMDSGDMEEGVWESLGGLEAPPPSASRLPSLLEAFGDPFHGEASAALELGAEEIRKAASRRELRARLATCRKRMSALHSRRCAAEELTALEARAGVSALSPEAKRMLQEAVYATAGVVGVTVRQAKGARPGRARAAAPRPKACFPWALPAPDRRAANRASAAKTRTRRRVWLHALKNPDAIRLALTTRLVL